MWCLYSVYEPFFGFGVKLWIGDGTNCTNIRNENRYFMQTLSDIERFRMVRELIWSFINITHVEDIASEIKMFCVFYHCCQLYWNLSGIS